MSLTCPRDGVELTSATSGSVSYWYCRDCGGIWIVRDNLATSLSEQIEFSKKAVAAGDLGKPLTCPECERVMKRDKFYGISIDVCTNDAGAWFDGGELGELLGIWSFKLKEQGGTLSAREIAQSVLPHNYHRADTLFDRTMDSLADFLHEMSEAYYRRNCGGLL